MYAKLYQQILLHMHESEESFKDKQTYRVLQNLCNTQQKALSVERSLYGYLWSTIKLYSSSMSGDFVHVITVPVHTW